MAYHHGDLRRALLQGALELLGEGGPSALTLRGAARRAGVSPAAPYRHFTDKRELLAAVAEEGFLALDRHAEEEIERAGADPVQRFRCHGLAYVRFAIDHPAHYRVMFGPEIPDKRLYAALDAASRAAYDRLRDSLRACQQAGVIPEGDIEIRAVRAWALVHGLASLFIDGQLAGTGASEREEFLKMVDTIFSASS
ncbi:MAG TPA: TetR/AcrR family transcriptional regulator [Candidatus Limnocylindrales bacterium]|nr:TetR/AcrR family transcriptional regulator [Candidatus Limnocylindrales bacterium]